MAKAAGFNNRGKAVNVERRRSRPKKKQTKKPKQRKQEHQLGVSTRFSAFGEVDLGVFCVVGVAVLFQFLQTNCAIREG